MRKLIARIFRHLADAIDPAPPDMSPLDLVTMEHLTFTNRLV